jgi:hypothetical protein
MILFRGVVMANGNRCRTDWTSLNSHFFCLDQAREMIEGTIVGGLGIFWKATAGQLPHFQMIGEALATDALPGTRVIRAVAAFQVFFLFAIHRCTPSV